MRVDPVAFVPMTAALVDVVAVVMHSGGNGLEDYAVRCAVRDFKAFIDRALRP